jgi:superfamily I DNA and/or RNA helicase
MFYNGRLRDGENVKSVTYNPSFLNGKSLKTVKSEITLDFPEKKMKEEKTREDCIQDKAKGGGGGSFLNSLDSFSKMTTSKKIPTIDTTPPSKEPSIHSITSTELDEKTVLLKPLLFFDLITSKDSSGGEQSSLVNIEESKLCMNILETLISQARKAGTTLGSIGIITPYSEQLQEIRKRLIGLGLLTATGGGSDKLLDIEVIHI